ncbi:MAG: permease [Rubrobacteraceae bacterium]|jgi:uncharacterized membrane protein YraQ (UPF0718 family)|nr:permease [Rubrobacter sp.]
MIGEIHEILGFVIEASGNVLPVFVVSVFLGVLVRTMKLDGAVRRVFGARVGIAILLATAVGAFSPFCSCTVVPVVAGLLIAGVPLAPVMSFWIASPTMDPEIFALSAGFLGWPLAVTRLVATLILSLGAGYLTLLLTRSGFFRGAVLRRTAKEKETSDCCATEQPGRLAEQPVLVGAGATQNAAMFSGTAHETGSVTTTTEACGSGCGTKLDSAPQKGWWKDIIEGFRRLSWGEVARGSAGEGWRIGRWLLLAFTMEALILEYVPQEAIAGTLGGSSAFAVPLAALVGLPLYMNEAGALPIVSGLIKSGMTPGAAIAFLIAGPATTVPAMAAVWSLVKPRVFALYVGVALIGAIVLGITTDALL